MKKKLMILPLVLLCTLFFGTFVYAKTVSVYFVTPYGIHLKKAAQGSNMTYKGPTDVNVPGYVFCGWSVPLANVQTDLIAWPIYTRTDGSVSASVDACNVLTHAPTGVLSYSTANGGANLEISNAVKAVPQTPMATPCTLTAEQSIRLNPVGVPGKTCVVKWYNGSNSELWKTDVVAYGASLPQPADPCISGLEFVGWDGSWTNITSDRNIVACYFKTKHIHFVCGKCGASFDETTIRSTDSYEAAAEGISLYDHHHGEFDGWDIEEYDGGSEVVMTLRFKD
ncbi:MAG: hypothetical protein K6E63_08275 [Lachnospiraceae bacterium]|nr:hypothetical protein [Lachnospiraceae bacterium]